MIVSRIRGGLGNQFFQYAVGRALARRRKTKLLLDVEWFDRPDSLRTFDLHRYRIQARKLLDSERQWIQKCTNGDFKRFGFVHRWTHFKEPDFNRYYPSVLDLRGNVYLDGFWQYPDYFVDCQDVICSELMPSAAVIEPNSKLIQRIQDGNSISVHVRRGDYLTWRFIGALPTAYYERAVALMISRVKSPHFFVFSDDPDWVRGNFAIDAPVDYMAHDARDARFKDLYLISLCRHHIIANSTFSWWAAWLSSSKSALVVAPRQWFAELSPDSHSRLPPTWIAL
jgi:hypothetical protein